MIALRALLLALVVFAGVLGMRIALGRMELTPGRALGVVGVLQAMLWTGLYLGACVFKRFPPL